MTNYGNYVTEAFRYYALYGKPSVDEIRRLPIERGATDDLMAVVSLIKMLDYKSDAAIWKRCLSIVYFSDPKHRLKRGTITSRVIFAAIELSISERTVYRIMQQLQREFAHIRGLRIS